MIILASASPRRQELIRLITDDFKIAPAQCEEIIPDDLPRNLAAEFLATTKALDTASRFPDQLVIGADTIVLSDNVLMGKPRDKEDAFRMLSSLSGKTHQVITGVCLHTATKQLSFSVQTNVTFYPLSEQEILQYIDSGEPMDKAGAYGIQGLGALLIEKIDGDYNNVVGLPVSRLARELKSFQEEFL